ncbi:MAG TPA: sigma-70 family RNA polymerase sigma factor [Jiangellaceae bacterium]
MRAGEPGDLSGRAPDMRAPTADEELVRALYDQHATALFSYVLRLVSGDRQRAEDVVQETLFRAWRNPQSLHPGRGSVRPWLWTVARNLVVDGERARRARPQEIGEPAAGLAPVDDGIDRALSAQVVLDALDTLTPEHRAALIETYYRGRSVSEAARSLGVPEGTVKSRTYYALRNLKSALEERGFGAAEVEP